MLPNNDYNVDLHLDKLWDCDLILPINSDLIPPNTGIVTLSFQILEF